MGAISDAFKRPSAYAAKKTDLFAEVKDRIDGAMFEDQLDEVEAWLDANEHTLPAGWRESFNDMVEVQREAIRSEDVTQILKDRFDF